MLFLFFGVANSYGRTKVNDQNHCPSGQHWVRAYHRKSYTRGDGVFVSSTEVRAHCQSNPPSFTVWSPRLKSGIPPKWEHPTEKAKLWTEDERGRVLEALSLLPNSLLVDSVQGIYRLIQFKEYAANPAAGFENNIALYDPAFQTRQNLTRILAHEFAHKLYRHFYDIDRGQEYARIADWKSYTNPKTAEKVIYTFRDQFVEEDGSFGPDEDFSNNIEYFLFEPKKLKKVSPKIYDWIEKKYGPKFKIGKGSK